MFERSETSPVFLALLVHHALACSEGCGLQVRLYLRMLIHFVQLSVMPASSKRVAKGKEQGYNLSELLPYAQKLITEGGPTGKDMVEEALDYYTKRAGTAPLLTTEEQSENKWDWSGEQIGVRDQIKNFMPEDVYTALDRDGKFKRCG